MKLRRLWNTLIWPARRIAMWWFWHGPKLPFGPAPQNLLGFALGKKGVPVKRDSGHRDGKETQE